MTTVLPPVAALELTYRCNHACRFCSCPWFAGMIKPSAEMSVDEWKRLIDEFAANGVRQFSFTASCQDPRKREIALGLLRHALEVNHDGVISLQILQEFTNVMLKRSLATDGQIEGYYSYFYRLVRSEVTSDMLREAIHIRREYGIQYHDAVMIAAAKKLGCHEIVTEELNDGQLYCGMAVVNPFK